MSLDEELKIYMQAIHFLDESTDEYLYFYDLVNDKIYFTDKIRKKYPLPSGKNGISVSEWAKIVYFRDVGQIEKNLEEIRKGLWDSHNMEYRLVDKNGERVWINCRGNVQKDEEGNPLIMVGCVTELARGRLVDNLTGLWNAEKFTEDMGKCLKENNGYLMVLGVDNLKSINLKHGRTYGNHVLRVLAEHLEEKTHFPQKIYRMYGDRFAVNFPREKKDKVLEFYNSIKKELEKYCTVSAGVAVYHSSDGADSGLVYQYAENALDRAKKEGKNTLVVFSAEDFKKNMALLELQDELKNSVKNGCRGFYLCYQPQIDSDNFSLYGTEALLRYESPTRGVIEPGEFIPFLEQSGLICQVGAWVLKTALLQCREWRKILPDFHISVNISYVQLRQSGIEDIVLDALHDAQLPGDALTLEVTESMQLQDYSYYNKIFYQWKRQGIKIAIDDFGTGYSSLSYLKSIDIDETKIDRCFVNRIHYNAYNYRLLSNMIDLAHSAQIRVCCEGVETEEELMALRELSPDVLQGFLFAKPCKKEEFENSYICYDPEEYQNRLRKEANYHQEKSMDDRRLLETLRKEEIINIVENMDELIYVRDIESYHLYYLNPTGRQYTGIYDYKGRKCYQILHNRKTPCELCSGRDVNSRNFCEWETENSFLKKSFNVKAKLIPWQGGYARLEIASESEKDKSSFDYKEILEETSLGCWKIYIDQQTGKGELYTDPIMDRNLGLDTPLNQEECYLHWYNRINEGYYNYVNLAVDNIIQTGKLIQLEYTWNHPQKGEVTVRCMGVRAKDHNGKICIHGYHRIISELEKPYFLPGGLDSEMFEFNENKKSIYFHTDRRLIAGGEKREQDFPECWIKNQIVHPHFFNRFREMFHDVQNKENNYGTEMLLRTKEGAYEWFKLKSRHLSARKKDANTIVVMIDPADSERAMELEYMRKSDFYEALISETVAYAEIDVESGHLTMAGGLWAEYEEKYGEKSADFEKIIHSYVSRVVCPEDVEEYEHHMDVNYMKEMYRQGTDTWKYSFRRYINEKLCWVEMVTHVFQDRYTENMYALLYLKNIDAEKKRELAQENAAQRDPLTNVYNRSAFEYEVVHFVETMGQNATGALILLDIDDFKKINDRYGHLKGDETLKALTDILKHTFRSQDLIGRLGGDEFLVFVKGVNTREILDHRMEELFQRLADTSEFCLACSAGISFANGKDINYRELVEKADNALYESKAKGKNQYSYFEK